MEFLSKSEEETIKIANDFGQKISSSPQEGALLGVIVVGLYGDLGAGKTTFMKGLAKYFGINDTIQSPTFVIEKIYEIPSLEIRDSSYEHKHLIHIDAYRIEKSQELITLGWNEIIKDSGNLICIEWPERILDIMPNHIKIEFEHIAENERKIKIR